MGFHLQFSFFISVRNTVKRNRVTNTLKWVFTEKNWYLNLSLTN